MIAFLLASVVFLDVFLEKCLPAGVVADGVEIFAGFSHFSIFFI